MRIRTETLAGTLEALSSGHADLAIAVVVEATDFAGVQMRSLRTQRFVFAVASCQPLAQPPELLADELTRTLRAIAVAESARQESRFSAGLLPGPETSMVSTVQAKLAAHLR